MEHGENKRKIQNNSKRRSIETTQNYNLLTKKRVGILLLLLKTTKVVKRMVEMDFLQTNKQTSK